MYHGTISRTIHSIVRINVTWLYGIIVKHFFIYTNALNINYIRSVNHKVICWIGKNRMLAFLVAPVRSIEGTLLFAPASAALAPYLVRKYFKINCCTWILWPHINSQAGSVQDSGNAYSPYKHHMFIHLFRFQIEKKYKCKIILEPFRFVEPWCPICLYNTMRTSLDNSKHEIDKITSKLFVIWHGTWK